MGLFGPDDFLAHRPVAGSGTPSDAAPQPNGTAAAGVSTDYSRADHVHALPAERSQVGFFLATNIAANTTTILNPSVTGGANYAELPIMRACTLTGLAGVLGGNATGSDLIVRISKNGTIDATLTLTIAVGARANSALGTGVTFGVTDRIGIHLVTDVSWTGTGLEGVFIPEVTYT